ncbi:MAG: nuclear transport factor 2 family protein [Pyrinomonadaceae bacterium]
MNNHHDGTKNDSKLWLAVLVIALGAAITVTLETSVNAQADHEANVREFVAAFNNRNIEAMLGAVDENVQWLTVNEAKVTIETEGKKALRESMERYFRRCPSCKSSLEWVEKSGSRVTAMERATWSGKSGLKSQTSLSVYEFRHGKILRVYYFPAEVDANPSASPLPMILRTVTGDC